MKAPIVLGIFIVRSVSSSFYKLQISLHLSTYNLKYKIMMVSRTITLVTPAQTCRWFEPNPWEGCIFKECCELWVCDPQVVDFLSSKFRVGGRTFMRICVRFFNTSRLLLLNLSHLQCPEMKWHVVEHPCATKEVWTSCTDFLPQNNFIKQLFASLIFRLFPTAKLYNSMFFWEFWGIAATVYQVPTISHWRWY